MYIIHFTALVIAELRSETTLSDFIACFATTPEIVQNSRGSRTALFNKVEVD